jgi:Leucine-rich repeat (LRR) protein
VNLKRLDAYKNSLTSITPSIAKMGKLKEFNIFNNQVTEIPAQIGTMGKFT